jgi:cytochrome c-type biogenesis protein CcmH/NrfF
MRAGKSDRQIKDAFIQEYGERILAEPEGAKAVVLTAIPVLAIGLGGAVLGVFLARQRRRLRTAPPQGPAELFPETDWD